MTATQPLIDPSDAVVLGNDVSLYWSDVQHGTLALHVIDGEADISLVQEGDDTPPAYPITHPAYRSAVEAIGCMCATGSPVYVFGDPTRMPSLYTAKEA
jgi:hypothetical protein